MFRKLFDTVLDKLKARCRSVSYAELYRKARHGDDSALAICLADRTAVERGKGLRVPAHWQSSLDLFRT